MEFTTRLEPPWLLRHHLCNCDGAKEIRVLANERVQHRYFVKGVTIISEKSKEIEDE